MRLIEIASLVDRVENGDALLQEVCRTSGAFDLTDRAVGDARRLQEMPLRGSQGQFSRLTLQCRIDSEVNRYQPSLHEPFHKCFCIRWCPSCVARSQISRENAGLGALVFTQFSQCFSGAQ